MKYLFRILAILLLVLMDIIVRLLELACYPLRVLWHFKLVEYKTTDYRSYQYPKGKDGLTSDPIGYYSNEYDYILDRNYKKI